MALVACNRRGLAPSEGSLGQWSLPPGVELATSGIPSATTTIYAKEKLAIH